MKMSRRQVRIPPEMIVTPDMASESEDPDPLPKLPSLLHHPQREKRYTVFSYFLFSFLLPFAWPIIIDDDR
jgi:hypothetical protein